MVIFLVWLLARAGDWLSMTTSVRIVWLGVAVLGGASVYLVAGLLTGLRPRDFRIV